MKHGSPNDLRTGVQTLSTSCFAVFHGHMYPYIFLQKQIQKLEGRDTIAFMSVHVKLHDVI